MSSPKAADSPACVVMCLAMALVSACGGRVEPSSSETSPCSSAGSETCDGVCVDVRGDSGNCGRCGHDCLGGLCTSGKCQPVVLATAQYAPTAIAADALNVYWANRDSGELMVVPQAGGVPVALVSSYSLEPTSVALDAQNLYYASRGWEAWDTGIIWKLRLDGSSPIAIATQLDSPYSIALDDTGVYWSNLNGATVMKVSSDGGPLVTVASDQVAPYGTALDASFVYWANFVADGTVMKAPLGGGDPIVVAAGQDHPYDLAVRASGIYWLNGGTADAQIMRLPIGAAAPVALATLPAKVLSLAADDDYVYVTGWGGLARVRVEGGTPEALVVPADHQLLEALALDSRSIYFAESGYPARVMRLAK